MQPSLEILYEINRCSDATQRYFHVLQQQNERLERENKTLRARLNQTSTNSSKPPSSNPFIKPRSLRVRSGRKPGGQPGHRGNTLRTSDSPDNTVEHKINTCPHCQEDLSNTVVVATKARQVFDVMIVPIVTEHRAEEKNCPNCGQTVVATFPQGVDHYIQYGDTFNAIMICLNKGHYVPYYRLSQISRDIFGISVSCGTLVNMVHACGQSLTMSMEHIKNQLRQANVVHFDETGIRLKGKNHWVHTAGNAQYTYFETHTHRGSAATDEIGILPEFEGIAVHDFWKSYYNYLCLHAICNAHILRELTGITENFNQEWSGKMKDLLVEIKRQVDAAGGALSKEKATAFEICYDDILAFGEQENPQLHKKKSKKRGRIKQSKARNLLNRMIQYKADILRFMLDPSTPFDNNQAERDIRMVKLFQKISGGFRSKPGNQDFDHIHSYISTAKKQGMSMFSSLRAAISGKPLFDQ